MEKIPEDTYRKNSNLLINLISIAVPLAVAILLAFPNKLDFGQWTKVLPHVIGSVNFLTTLVLILGFIFIKQKKITLHRTAMVFAIALGGVFLVCYVTYHISNPSNRFNGEGTYRVIYLIILATHILLSLIVLPLVLRAFFFAITGQIENHKRIVRFSYPIWLYVSTTGVLVYLMLYQLFPSN